MMNRNQKKRRAGVIGLFVLLLIISSLIQQMKYYGIAAVIGIVLMILAVIILWRYLLHHHIITITWSSMTYEPTSYKSERIFLFSLVALVAPILRLHDLTLYDGIISVAAIAVGIIGFILNERRLAEKVRN